MTLDDLRQSTRDVLTPTEVASILGIRADALRVTAREAPERLGFRVIVVGRRVLIPKQAFWNWMNGNHDQK